MKSRKIATAVLMFTLILSSTAFAFAAEPTTDTSDTNIDKIDSSVPARVDNRFKTRRVYVKTEYGTQGNTSDITKSTKKVEWEHKVYKIYRVDVTNGQKVLQYTEYEWTWRGYTREKGEVPWHFVKKMSGVDRKPLDVAMALLF